ncbi:TRP-domain-containing protein [Patellaria atrata CBS 101060]|uniref:TRP-domain-containing protein n=1 Tax=Patellaria atrata CBS 101060 TaxID=1346257 RepID=A0A9P4S4T6_9PEZI|nr:TRP-domain-containing protein [Patellaria atrata CBS 101060]
MHLSSRLRATFAPLLLLGTLPLTALAGDILETSGFSMCSSNSDIQIQRMNIKFDRRTNRVTFDVAGSSAREVKVKAKLTAFAYGRELYTKEFNPCDEETSFPQLCPVPSGEFASAGDVDIPNEFASQIPDIAFNIPDIDGTAKMELLPVDGGDDPVACVESVVKNGKTTSVPAVSYAAGGIVGGALILSGLSALAAGGHPGAASPSPTFGECLGWFQSMAMNGMLSVQYPQVYRNFAKNFAFSTGLFEWDGMQRSIDSFRKSTGGNLTEANVDFLRNATLVHQARTLNKRSFDEFLLYARDFTTTINGTTIGSANSTTNSDSKVMHYVEGIQAYVEELSIPQANTFMTILLVFAIIVASIAVGILLFKVILEGWALFGSFPKSLTGFRKRYWWTMAKTITNLILLLYGIWTLWCIYQFTNGDSWGAKILAGVTLALFTAVLGYFTFKIWQVASKFKKVEGDAHALFEDKETWRKYSIFYENYKQSYWWIFIPVIVYMFAKGCIIAGASGHGLVQAGGQLIIESLLLLLLLWVRPFSLKSGNWINITIQVVRVLSVVCVLVFVEELGVAQSTQTITGVVLIVLQAVLTGLLAILIAVNAIVVCCRANPHRKKRKEAEKLNRDLDTLTPLDARNSLLMDPTAYKSADPQMGQYDPIPLNDNITHTNRFSRGHRNDSPSRTALLNDSASLGHGRSESHARSLSHGRTWSEERAPRLPDVEVGRGY